MLSRILAVMSLPALLFACGVTVGDDQEIVEHAGGGKPCASSNDCPGSMYCTTEDDVCNPPPGCAPNQPCLAVCYGTCQHEPSDVVEECGPTVCGAGEVCCNASCGICTQPDEFCIQIACEYE
jgi:hypothetical protein